MKDFTRVREKVDQLNVIDDTLFQKMAEDKDFCEEMISTILGEKIKVLQVIPQESLRNLQGRSVIVDALCEMQDGRCVNAEVQKANDDDHQKRVRYNASCITANVTDPGVKFRDVPDLIMIYITKFDVFKKRKTVYHVDRVVRESGETVENGMTEVYVNTKIDDGSDIAELMRIFTEIGEYDYEKFPYTSARKAHFKKSEEGALSMCEIVEKYAKEIADEAVRENEEKMIKKMFKRGMTVEQIMTVTESLTEEEVINLERECEV